MLTDLRPDFKLLETMLWEPEDGIFLLDEHLQRLGKSAAYFDIPLDLHAVLISLEEVGRTCAGVPHRIRLLVSREGTAELEMSPLDEGRARSPSALRTARRSDSALIAALAAAPVDWQDIFLFHKTTHREVYEKAKAAFPEVDDVILWNERREVTESTIANVVIQKDGRYITPPVNCGLLAGTFRGHLLQSGEIEEGIITLKELEAADKIFLISSVRKWRSAELK